jgi:periplasmic divalent cation tolerance protein
MQDCKGSDILVVTTTVGSMDDARRFARSLVERRLAACVQLDEIAQSLYRWDGKLCEEPEVRISIKTMPHLLASLEKAFEQLHPYEVAQFVAATHYAAPEYAQWVRAEVRPA